VEGVSLLGTGAESLSGGGELEGPEEVVGLLELGSDGPDLVDEVLNALDASVLKSFTVSDDGVIGDGDSGSVDLAVSSLVDELLDGGSGRVSVGDVGLDNSDHVHGGLGHSDEHSVVELSESKELHDLLALGAQLVDTSGSDDKGNLGLSLDEVVSFHDQILRVKDCEEIPFVLCGNKCDLEKERKVSKTEGQDCAKELKCKFFETSAKMNFNVSESFETLVREIKAWRTSNGAVSDHPTDLVEGKKRRSCVVF